MGVDCWSVVTGGRHRRRGGRASDSSDEFDHSNRPDTAVAVRPTENTLSPLAPCSSSGAPRRRHGSTSRLRRLLGPLGWDLRVVVRSMHAARGRERVKWDQCLPFATVSVGRLAALAFGRPES